jgi:hypothetical protein
MTLDTNIPVASQSPSLYPPQSHDTLNRFRTLLTADHQVNNTTATNDGYHNLIHMQPVTIPSGLAGIGQLYVKISSVTSKPELFFMDSAGVETKLVPSDLTLPIRVIGAVNTVLTGMATNVIYPDPGFDYTGFAIAYYAGTANQSTYNIIKIGSPPNPVFTDIHLIDDHNTSGGSAAPTLSFSGGNLLIKNNGNPGTVVASLIINRSS